MTESSCFWMLASAPVGFTVSQGERGRGHSLGVLEQDKVTLNPATLLATPLFFHIYFLSFSLVSFYFCTSLVCMILFLDVNI